jgi:hypothetical protein
LGPTASQAILPEARGDEPGALLIGAAVRVQQLPILDQLHIPSETGVLVSVELARLRPRLLAQAPDFLVRLRSERRDRALRAGRAERLFV